MTYTEDALVEQPAINLFSEIGWQTLDCYSETFGDDSLLGRDNCSDVVIVRGLREALTQIKDYQKCIKAKSLAALNVANS
jgi:type I restriction enzyme R subunit